MFELSSTMLCRYLLFYIILILQADSIYSDCSQVNLCTCDTNAIICDAYSSNQTEYDFFSPLSQLPSVENYYFYNFKKVPSQAFQNVTFLNNHSITIHLINVKRIESYAFSTSIIIPDYSTVSVNIESSIESPSITLQIEAFNNMKINRLRFFNISNFNGRPIFDTNCFGKNLYINELVFEQSGITGFTTTQQDSVNVNYLSIRKCSEYRQLTSKSLPSFLSRTQSLEISNTGLQLINPSTFQAQSLVLKQLIIRDNMNFNMLSSNIVDGILKELDMLDLSNNPINGLQPNFDWTPFSSMKHLVLQKQQMDLFLKTNILNISQSLNTVDLSEGFVLDNNENLIRDYVPVMPNLALINISFTNLTENMVIDLLESLSESINQTLAVSLLGYALNDSNFCEYYKIFQKSSNLLQLELDETHKCNCVVDLFYDNILKQVTCLLNTTRIPCDIQSQVNSLKCPVDKPNPSDSRRGDKNNILMGVLIGLAALVIVLVVISLIVRRRRQRINRRMAIAYMADSVENPLAVIIEQRLRSSH